MSLSDTRMEFPAGQGGHRRRRSCQMAVADNTNLPTNKNVKTRQKHHRGSSRGRIDSNSDLEQLLEDGSERINVAMDHLSDDGLHNDEESGLTDRERNKRRLKKNRRRNTLLDSRIGTAETHPVIPADNHLWRRILVNGVLIILWYTFSLFISIYNKWMFDPTHLDFHFPLFTTCFHMLVQFFLSFLVLSLIPKFRPRRDLKLNSLKAAPATNIEIETPQQREESWMSLISMKHYFTHIGPCGMATGLDIGLGNMSLKFISLTFYTMCKSSSLAFILLFAFLFRLEPPSIRLVLIIAIMTLGVLMMVAGETKFSPLGFILVITAAFFSGFRWGLTQILLLTLPATSNPFSSIFYLAPVMFLSLFLLAIPIEGLANLFAGFQILIDNKGPILGPLLLLFPGTIAFCMTASEFALLQRTSVVTLSIAGIFKEIVTITSAGLVFQDQLTPVNISGLIVTLAAIISYNFIKFRQMRHNIQEEICLLEHGENYEENTPKSDVNKLDSTYNSDAEIHADADVNTNMNVNFDDSDDDLDIVDDTADTEFLLKNSKNSKFK